MEKIKYNGRLTPDERETHILYDPTNDTWEMETTIPKHFRKALKQGWTPTVEYVYDDGTVCGMVLTASARGVGIKNPNKKRVMSELQMQNLRRHKDDADEDDDDE